MDGSTRDVLLRLFADHGIDVEPGPAAAEQARAWASDPRIDDKALDDLTSIPFATLDSRHAMDLDQALHVEPNGSGHVVRYAIADASHYVAPGTPLWDEALRRGASYYLPGIVAPMLPRVLSEDVVSLNAGVDRRAVVFVHALDAEGICTRTDVVRARIRSRAKLGFAETQAFIDGGDAPRGMADVAASLVGLREVGRRRIRLADERGVVRFRRSEVHVAVAAGAVPGFTSVEPADYEVENYNEQLSLLCNIEGAKLLQAEDPEEMVQPIYRTHPPPTEAALAKLEGMIRALVRAHGKSEERWAWSRDTALATYLAALPRDGADGQLARVVHRQALLVGGRAQYTDEPAKHHGVGAEAYARFSAPMREIVGVYCHAELIEGLSGSERANPDGVDDEALRSRVVESATRAKRTQSSLERAANRLVIDALLGEDCKEGLEERPVRRGTLMGLGRGKAYVRLDEPPIDLKVYAKHLESESGKRMRIGPDGVRLFAGREAVLTVGERVDVVAAGRDARTDRWRLRCRAAR